MLLEIQEERPLVWHLTQAMIERTEVTDVQYEGSDLKTGELNWTKSQFSLKVLKLSDWDNIVSLGKNLNLKLQKSTT